MQMMRNWKKEEFSSPDVIWELDLNGTVIETVKGKVKERKVDGAYVKLVYLYLIRCLDIHNDVFPSYNTIGKYTHLSKMSVIRCIKVLEDYQLIAKTKRKKEGKKENDSNVYLINHPHSIKSVSYIDEVVPHIDNGGTPRRPHVVPHVDNGSIPGVPYKDLNTSVLKDSVCNRDENFKIVGEAWRNCFQEEMSEIEFINLHKKSSTTFLLNTINDIKKYHDHTSIKSAFAFVSKCIDIGGYVVKEKKQKIVNKKSKSPTLPKAVSKTHVEKPVDEARRKRVQEKINRLG